jgi:hypothetical protein
MPRQVQVGFLAAAALAAFAVAGVRIAHAVRGQSSRTLQIPVYGSSPSAEAAIFRSLRVPPGFRRFDRCDEGECFALRTSLPLDTATAARIAQEFDVRIASSFAKGAAVECGWIVHRACRVEGIVRGEYVWLWLQRPEVLNPKPRTARNRRKYQRFVLIPGTEAEVSILGHCLHPKQCEEERHQEAAESESRKLGLDPAPSSK